MRGLLRRGFNTLLFPRLAGTYTEMPVNNDRVEFIIALHSTPGMRGTCADGFMTGWNHGSVCSCKESLGVVNCRGGKSEIAHDAPPPPAKTGRHHSIVRNLTFASLEPPLAPDEPMAAYLERLYHEAPREPLELTSLQWFWWGAPLRVDCSWPSALNSVDCPRFRAPPRTTIWRRAPLQRCGAARVACPCSGRWWFSTCRAHPDHRATGASGC